jgi:hypothetical protein
MSHPVDNLSKITVVGTSNQKYVYRVNKTPSLFLILKLLHSRMRLHGAVLNWLSQVIILPFTPHIRTPLSSKLSLSLHVLRLPIKATETYKTTPGLWLVSWPLRIPIDISCPFRQALGNFHTGLYMKHGAWHCNTNIHTGWHRRIASVSMESLDNGDAIVSNQIMTEEASILGSSTLIRKYRKSWCFYCFIGRVGEASGEILRI